MKRLGLGVSQVDWTTTFDLVVQGHCFEEEHIASCMYTHEKASRPINTLAFDRYTASRRRKRCSRRGATLWLPAIRTSSQGTAQPLSILGKPSHGFNGSNSKHLGHNSCGRIDFYLLFTTNFSTLAWTSSQGTTSPQSGSNLICKKN